MPAFKRGDIVAYEYERDEDGQTVSGVGAVQEDGPDFAGFYLVLVDGVVYSFHGDHLKYYRPVGQRRS